MNFPYSATSQLDWPSRFLAAYGRRPRVLHVGNIGNYAWVNLKLMQQQGADCVLLDPDSYHIVSAPEWAEAEVTGPIGDPFHPNWNRLTVRGFKRPEFLLNGPTPFVARQMMAMEIGRVREAQLYALFSRLYRQGLASTSDKPSLFRRVMESDVGLALAVKRLAKRLTMRERAPPDTIPKEDGICHRPSVEPTLPTSLSPARLKAALARFDIIVGYALGGRFAHAVAHPRHVALEIGTLRGLVFEDTQIGRLGAEIYRQAPAVFVTNVDCLEPARRLGIPDERISAIPHPFDLPFALHFASQSHSCDRTGAPIFLCPARHHWKQGNASWLKGNDVLIRGAALAASRGARFKLQFIDWGVDVQESRALIRSVGLEERCEWLPLLPRKEIWRHISRSVAVLDQFSASAFGTVALEGMALGRRVISRLEQTDLKPFFDVPPPFLHTTGIESVASRIMEVLADPDDALGLGKRGQDWMRQHHGVEQQLHPQFAAFDRLIEAHGPAPL